MLVRLLLSLLERVFPRVSVTSLGRFYYSTVTSQRIAKHTMLIVDTVMGLQQSEDDQGCS